MKLIPGVEFIPEYAAARACGCERGSTIMLVESKKGRGQI